MQVLIGKNVQFILFSIIKNEFFRNKTIVSIISSALKGLEEDQGPNGLKDQYISVIKSFFGRMKSN